MLCNLLKKQINNNIKCNIVIVYNGLDCLKFFQSNVCDLIIMDINMPILNGIDTRQQINNKETGRNVPIIFISANINNKKKNSQ